MSPDPIRTATTEALFHGPHDHLSGSHLANDGTTSDSDNDKYEKSSWVGNTDDTIRQPELDASTTAIATATAAITTKPSATDAEIPDGGYGWFVVAGCATLTFWFGGTTYSWGIMQTALINQGLGDASTLSFVGSTTIAAIAALALVNARIVRLLGARNTALLGVVFMGIGETTASFTTHSIGGLFGTESIIMGIGVSLCFMVSSVTPAQYFKKKRGLANGIVYAGGGLGGTIISFVMDAINQRLGIEWTFRIIGISILATGIPMAFLIKDRNGPPPSTKWVEWVLFKDFRFVTLFLCGLIATFPLFVPVFFIPLYAESFGISSLGGAGLVAGFQFASLFGRLGGGALADTLGALNTLVLSLLFNAISMLLIWPLATSIAPLIVFVILNGAANGTFFATMPTVVANIFGGQRVGVVMGMIVTAWTGGYLLGSPIAGYILNATGNYHDLHSYLPTIFYAGGLSAVALVFGLMTRINISRSVAHRV